MHDIRLIRDDPAAFDAAMARRGVVSISQQILAHDKSKREIQNKIENLRADKKTVSGHIGQLASLGQGNTEEAMSFRDQSIRISQTLSITEDHLKKIGDPTALISQLPNRPAPDDPTKPAADRGAPDGKDESDNVEVLRWGTPRAFDFPPREHADQGPTLGMDFETGVLISGARFTFLRGQMARLHRALGQFMLDKHIGPETERSGGYTECNPPLLVNDESAFGTGQLPKFEDDLFKTDISLGPWDYIEYKNDKLMAAKHEGRISKSAELSTRAIWDRLPNPPTRRWLIPTAEVSLTNSVRKQILPQSALPMRMTALTPCFRAEAGAAGRDTRGFIRQHQFEKVEMVSICAPEDSDAEHERMTLCAEGILQALDLPYRKMLLCAGDMGFTAKKTYDLEVWLPGQNAYREISSCSNCGDFQARRMNARFRPAKEDGGAKGTEFVHTLNGSGLAVGRTLVAVLENYQQADGSVDVPQALLPCMGGLTRLVPTPA